MNQGTKEEIDAASKEAAAENAAAAASTEPGPTEPSPQEPAAGEQAPAEGAIGTAASTGANEGSGLAQAAALTDKSEHVATISVRKIGATYFTSAATSDDIFPAHESDDLKQVIEFVTGFLLEKANA